MTAGIIPQLSCIVKVMFCTAEEIVDGYAAVVADQEEADCMVDGQSTEARWRIEISMRFS